MPERNIVVVGTSSGGVETLAQMARGFPSGFPASVFVVCHFQPEGKCVLPEILCRAGKLPAAHAKDGEPFQKGHIYVAPPDRHLVVGPAGRVHLNRDARENHHRPAVDPLFRSAARHYGPRVIGVVLTGALTDGTAGLMAIRAAGGLAVVQDPADAVVGFMPQHAADIAGADHIVPASELAARLIQLVGAPVPETPGADALDPIAEMPEVVKQDMVEQALNERRGELSTFTCPECGGALWQIDQDLPHFRCHVGHAYNGDTLLADQSEVLEAALWSAVRGFREKAVLCRQLEAAALDRGNDSVAQRFRDQATQAAEYSDLIVKHVLHAEAKPATWSPRFPLQDQQGA